MVRARLQKKEGYFYAVLSFRDSGGKRKEIWRRTGIRETENPRRAERLCEEYREKLIFELSVLAIDDKFLLSQRSFFLVDHRKTLFGDYIENWLEYTKNKIELTTYSAYRHTILSGMKPYFNNRLITLQELTARDLSLFYQSLSPKVKASTVEHYHAIIRHALQFAYENDLVPSNIADKVQLPKTQSFVGHYYNQEELLKLINCVKGDRIEFAVLMACFYGLRRSEIVGLKWENIDFVYKTISIIHTVTSCSIAGKQRIIARDRTKTSSSLRTLPLMPEIESFLLKMKQEQNFNAHKYGNYYNNDNSEYVYRDQFGNLIKPNYITQHFQIVLKRAGMPRIRFHDLRHSCATLLRHNGVRMEDIQRWLGHSSIETTEKIYSHFEDKDNIPLARIMQQNLFYTD